MNIDKIETYLELWDTNNLEKLWHQLEKVSTKELAFVVSWMTAIIRDEGEVRLSQWLVWLETKAKNQ